MVTDDNDAEYVEGLFAYARCSEIGIGCVKSLTETVEIYRRLVNECHVPKAMVRLEKMFEKGSCVPNDLGAAIELCGFAAEIGNLETTRILSSPEKQRERRYSMVPARDPQRPCMFISQNASKS
jgi:TPR repeat protein